MGIFGRPKPPPTPAYVSVGPAGITLPGGASGSVTISGVGAGGGGGNYGYANGTLAYTTVATGMAYQANAHATFSDDLTINRPGKSPIKVAETLDMILEQLLILQPNFEQMEKYPALKAAYDNYKLMEALCKEDNTKDNDV